MTRLSVNLNEVALLRNQRGEDTAYILDAAKAVFQAGAQGVDLRWTRGEAVRQRDVAELSALVADLNSPFPSFMMQEGQTGDRTFTLSGPHDEEFLTLAAAHRCDWVVLTGNIAKAQGRTGVLIGPDIEAVEAAAAAGVERIVLRTEREMDLKSYARAAKRAIALNLSIGARGDLNLDNIAKFISAMPACDEVCVGHAIMADALKMGWHSAVSAYLTAISYGRQR